MIATDNILTLKLTTCCAAGAIGAMIWPSLPFIGVCWLLTLVDWLTAIALARRVRRTYGESLTAEGGRVSSRRTARVAATLGRIAAVLLLAHTVQTVIVGPGAGIDVMKLTAAAICVWQVLSILENEAACNGSRWAAVARRVIIDKTERHLGVRLDEEMKKKAPAPGPKSEDQGAGTEIS